MGTNVNLTPELERFAKNRVLAGGYNNVSEVVREGLRLLQASDVRRLAFEQSLTEAEREGDRLGFHSSEAVLSELDRIIDAADD